MREEKVKKKFIKYNESRPIDKKLAGVEGFEPSHLVLETSMLPLTSYPYIQKNHYLFIIHVLLKICNLFYEKIFWTTVNKKFVPLFRKIILKKRKYFIKLLQFKEIYNKIWYIVVESATIWKEGEFKCLLVNMSIL